MSSEADPPPLPVTAQPPTEAAESGVVLRVEGLTRSFGAFRAVDGLELTVRRGEIYGFLGRNGAGKTTTIRMLMGIIKPDGGTLELLGERTRRTSLKQKRRIGYVSQSQHIYPWMTCRAVGRFVGGFYPQWDANEFSRLLEVFDLPADRKFAHLSGGMKMKLALAAALSHHPALLLLDEPTSGLDPVAQREFLDLVQHHARRHHTTTFFSSHRIDEVERVADRIGIIDRGRLRYEGDLDLLKDSVRRVCGVPEIAEVTPTLVDNPEDEDPEDPNAPPSLTPPPLPGAAVTAARAEADSPFSAAAGFELLRDESSADQRRLVYRAEPAAWASTPAGSGQRVERLSLEDIFLAFAASGSPLV